MNCDAVDGAIDALHKVDVPASWKDAVDEPVCDCGKPEFITRLLSLLTHSAETSFLSAHLLVSKTVLLKPVHHAMRSAELPF